MADHFTLEARCHCGSAHYKYSLPRSVLPLKSSICSCTTCRRISGQIFASFVVVPDQPRPDTSKLTAYASSPNLTRFFCPQCGCSVLNFDSAEWEFASGVLEGPIDGLLDRQALFAGDSGDGGAFIWLPKENGAGLDLRTHVGFRDSEVVDAEAMSRNFEAKRSAISHSDRMDDRLNASCHCGAFQCYITRPSADSPEPDPKRGRWWLTSDGNHYTATLDACGSCRRVTGFELNSWTYIPPNNFFMPDGSQLNPSEHPALEHYQSSPGTHRDFCGTCGTSVFFRKDSRSPQVWDIGVGLLNGAGARAQDWLEWRGLEFEGFASDSVFARHIREGMTRCGHASAASAQ